ncbi:hypothetical protein K1T71_005628 [Dendrolimus kikuchii]|uniref:Uncharacterized protein n=1 Tax=Dendrolimus kikuchii TaxID=765133 RepID=A0ACC1D4K6_9NEOP|nr:hypothetical protein K1T71_005628 [Dendrolimus kikuchii]
MCIKNDSFATNISALFASNELIAVAAKIAHFNYNWQYATFVFFNTTVICAEEFIRLYRSNVIVGRGSFRPNFASRTRQFVVLGNNVANIEYMLHWMMQYQFDNTGKFIILCTSNIHADCKETQAIETFWHYKITNVIYLKVELKEVTGYTYYPLYDNNCKTDIPVKIKNITHAYQNTNIFSEKLKNLNKCEIIASTVIQKPYMNIVNGKPTGTDGDLLNLIAEGLNAHLKVMTPRYGDNWGKLERNNTWSGSLGDVYYDFANFSMTSSALTATRASNFQMSISYNSVNIVWISHPPSTKPAALKLMYPFQPSALVALTISFTVVVLCALFTKSEIWLSVRRTLKIDRCENCIILYSWMACMGIPLSRLPNKRTHLFIIIIWIWYCLLLRTFYQVRLINVLKGRFCYEGFKTLDEVITSKYTFGGAGSLIDYYIDDPIIYSNWINIKVRDIMSTIFNISRGMKFVLATNKPTVKIISKEHKINIHILPEIVSSTPTVIFFKKFSPLVDSVNRIMSHLTEAGFSDKLYKSHTSTKTLFENTNYPEAIKLVHYTGCYAILFLGWTVSVLLFFMEIYFGKR